MKRSKVCPLLFTIIMALSVGSCAGDESSSSEAGAVSGFEYITLAELPGDIETARSGSYQTFKVGVHINVNIPERISELHIKGKPVTEELIEKLTEHYGVVNMDQITVDKDPHAENYIDHRTDTSQFIIGKIGCISCFPHIEASDHDTKGTYQRKTVFFDSAENGMTVTYNGIEHSVSELAERSKAAINGFEAQINGFECIPVKFYYDNQRAVVSCARIVKGYYRPFCSASIDIEKITPETEDFVGMDAPCRVFFQDGAEPIGFCDDWWETSAEYTAGYDRMISMTSALKYLDKQLAEYMDLDMDHACIVQLQKNHEVRLLNEEEFYKQDFTKQILDLETHPFWQFIFHSKYSENDRYIAVIDCITGKFSFTNYSI